MAERQEGTPKKGAEQKRRRAEGIQWPRWAELVVQAGRRGRVSRKAGASTR